ncbi:MAG TPA: DUF4157 domain-containing protein [Kofleriaceae bacterium]|nr:DUF4157 domain-containing protein [Kofleriaceae bacterium]
MRDVKISGPAGGATEQAESAVPGKATLSGPIYRKAREAAPEGTDALAGLGGSSGVALPGDARARLEASAGADLSDVRVHTGPASARAADQLGARAFTTGRDIHFAAGQYQPSDPSGAHLLAHEVAHTVQQRGGAAGPQTKLAVSEPGDAAEVAADQFADHAVHGGAAPALGSAPAGVVHRTPAAPSYGGVTGVRDLTKLTVDALPDFVASTLTAPRAIHAHPSDPAIKHLTWELYDPSDNMLAGFSTLPGQPTSTTAPFQLEPAVFNRPSFVPGRYVLRCEGLDDHHRPITYADRDFNVVAADQTTGTGAATGHGTITFTRYDKTDGTPANPAYSVNAQVSFTPDPGAGITDAVFMQSIQTIDARGNSQQNTVNADQDARQSPLAWSIDRVAGAPGPFYIEGNVTRRVGGRNVTRVEDNPGWGQAGRSNGAGAASTPATLIDTPAWNHENFFKAESVVMCRSGANRGQVYGACTWGYSATSAGVVTLMPRSVHPTPSDDFAEAKALWNAWQARQPAGRAPSRAP